MFGELLGGDQPVKKIVLVTTMWDKVERYAAKFQDTHNQRENQLFDNYWKRMMDYGASTARFSNSPDSAWQIINIILKQHESEVLLLQEEILDLKRALNETQAGRTLYSGLQRLLAERQNVIRSFGQEARDGNNPQLTLQLEAELKRIQKDFDKTLNEMKSLKIPFDKRLMPFFGKKSRGGEAS